VLVTVIVNFRLQYVPFVPGQYWLRIIKHRFLIEVYQGQW